MNRKFLCLLFSLFVALNTFALDDGATVHYDFVKDGVAYKYVSQEDKTVEVAPIGEGGANYENISVVKIPEFVVDGANEKYKVIRIGHHAFYGASYMSKQLQKISIPSTVIGIDEQAFYYCNSVKTLVVDENNPAIKSVDNVIYSKDGKELVVYLAGKEDVVYTVPQGVTSIANWAFAGGSPSLQKVILPRSVKQIGTEAFYYQQSSDASVFSIYCYADAVPDMGTDVFAHTSKAKFFVPNYLMSAYQEAEQWKDYEIADATVYLYEEQDNTETMTAQNGQYAYVQIDRELTADGGWYTLCLPFDLSEEQIAESFGDCSLMQLEYADKRSKQLLYIHFATAKTLQANTPYLFKPANSLTPPIFKGVAIKYQTNTTITTPDGLVSMTGIYASAQVPKDSWYLGPDNTLYQPQGNVTSNGFRAYFTLPSSLNDTQGLRARVVMDGETPTDINDVQITTDTTPQKVFDNGQIFILRGGHKYNLQGQVVE